MFYFFHCPLCISFLAPSCLVFLAANFGGRHGGFAQSNEWSNCWDIYPWDGDWSTTAYTGRETVIWPSLVGHVNDILVLFFVEGIIFHAYALELIGWSRHPRWKSLSYTFRLESTMSVQMCILFLKVFCAEDDDLVIGVFIVTSCNR